MKRLFSLLLATFALLFVASSSAFPTKRTDRAIKQVLQEFQAVGISAAVVKKGKIVYNNSFGCKDLGSKTPVGHSGSAQGLKSIMIWSPADGWGIVAMTNGYTKIHNKDIMKTLTNAIYESCIKK